MQDTEAIRSKYSDTKRSLHKSSEEQRTDL